MKRADDTAPSDGNIAGYRCPRCASKDVVGRRRTYGERTIEELFCPRCELNDVADSDRPDYVARLERWRRID